MIDIIEKKQCCGCSACYNICPKQAITMEEDEKGFKYPIVDKEKCIDCKLCKKVCPIINNKKVENEPKAYACINKNDEIRKESSSGGIFTLLAEEIINMKGFVFGAVFDENFNVIHKYVKNKEQLKELRGSKYLQSDIKETYKEAKIFLEQGKYVLFTGTPCQIEGLKSFLQRDYDKLYTQDIICHGVPSRKVWQKYLDNTKNIKYGKIKNINFRNKRNSWENYSMNIEYDHYTYNNNHNNDMYMKAFLQNLSLRDSCYDCSFKKFNRNSDITLADFWGISKIKPNLNDHKGTSLVIINSQKGNSLFEKIKNKCVIDEIDINEAIKYNKSFISSEKQNEKRDKFFEDFNNEGVDFKDLIKKYTTKQSIARKISNKSKNIIKRILKK